MVRRCLENKAPKYLSRASTALRGYRRQQPTSAISQPASADCTAVRGITFGRRAFSVAGTDRVFIVCPSFLVTLDARWRQYCSLDISALSAIEMRSIILRYINFLFYSILFFLLLEFTKILTRKHEHLYTAKKKGFKKGFQRVFWG